MGLAFWTELPEILNILFSKHDCRCIVLRGLGKNFSAGLDLNEAASYMVSNGEDPARDSYRRLQLIRQMQLAISSVANSPVPVIACVQGAVVGGGVDLITVCCSQKWRISDWRWLKHFFMTCRHVTFASLQRTLGKFVACWFTVPAFHIAFRFCIKEVDVGIVAGTPFKWCHIFQFCFSSCRFQILEQFNECHGLLPTDPGSMRWCSLVGAELQFLKITKSFIYLRNW